MVSHSLQKNHQSGQQNDGDATSISGSSGSFQPSPRFDRRDHGSLQNISGGGGGVGVGATSSSSSGSFLRPDLPPPLGGGGGGPTKTNSFPVDLYDTPSNQQLSGGVGVGGKAGIVAAEGWYSSPASHRQEIDGAIKSTTTVDNDVTIAVGSESGAGGSLTTPKKGSPPLDWSSATSGKSASPIKMRTADANQDSWTVRLSCGNCFMYRHVPVFLTVSVVCL